MTITEASPTVVRPANRGQLTIADRVIERIAGQAAREVSSVAGRSGGLLGIGSSDDFDAAPKVDVQLDGTSATIQLALGVAYPASIRAAADEVRTAVVDTVRRLTGVQVTRLDVQVTALRRRDAAADKKRRLA